MRRRARGRWARARGVRWCVCSRVRVVLARQQAARQWSRGGVEGVREATANRSEAAKVLCGAAVVGIAVNVAVACVVARYCARSAVRGGAVAVKAKVATS